MRVSSKPSETNYVGSIPTIGVFLYVAQAVERVLAVSLRKQSMLVRVPLSACFFM